MAYTVEELTQVANQILGQNPVVVLGLPRAVEECAIQLFLADRNDETEAATVIIKEALSDLRGDGFFKYKVE